MLLQNEQLNPETIFSLDIGTRSVVGLIVESVGDGFRVVDCEIQEHDERSMLDGQIHDVPAVARVIARIKQALEQKHGPLHEVAVAAAGRSLRTRRVKVDVDIRDRSAITRDDILALELSAVQAAQAELAQELKEQDSTRYYCVGYSVVNFFLDGEVIGSLIDQRGETASADVIATFLPRVVVDSLISALKRCDLDMRALTLEPIAAINVLIPPTMRRLNIALVDIGAGTSDIALTEEGTITAYGMVPVAGDEITDALMNAFLLDFPIAETVKRSLSEQESVSFQDILGVEQTLTREEIVKAIEGEIERLAAHIADKIIELNGKPPQAVMLIGGGSLTPDLPEKVAAKLNLPQARVAVRGADAIRQFVGDHPLINGPEFVTPVGIAIAARKHPIKYLSVTVNDQELRLFDLRKLTVGDALLAAGMDIRRLYGRPGLAKTVTVNGRMRIIPGGHGSAPAIMLNGQPVGLDAPLADGDMITAIPGENGKDAEAAISHLIDEVDTLDVTVNGQPVSLSPIARVNGEQRPLDSLLDDRDQVDIRLPRTVKEVLSATGLLTSEEAPVPTEMAVTINGRTIRVPTLRVVLLVNGKPASLADRVRSGDAVDYVTERLPYPSIADLVPPEEWVKQEITVTFNGQPVHLPVSTVSIHMDGVPASGDTIVHDGAVITVSAKAAPNPVFSDVFRYVDIKLDQLAQTGATQLHTLVNGQPVSFQTEIKHGDKLELYWE